MDKKLHTARHAIITQVAFSTCLFLFVLSDFLEPHYPDANIGEPIIMAIALVQIVTGLVVLWRLRSK